MENRIRVLIADDHPIFLDGFCTVVQARYRELEVVAAVTNGREAVEADTQLQPDVVLLDVRMPEMTGVEAAREIRRRRPGARIIMLTTFSEGELIAGAFEAGVMGYILKDQPIAEVVVDIKAVHQGNVLITADVADKIGWPFGQAADHELPPKPGVLDGLTRREHEVLRLIARGRTNREIAEELEIGEGTVRNYVSRIYEVLGLHHRTAVILWAFEHEIK